MRNPVPLSAWIVLALTGASLVFPLMDAAPSSSMGPLSVTIIGPETVTAGEDVNFTCSADCSPSCTYTWMLEGQTADGKVATVTPSGAAKSLEMECTALNPESGKSLKMAKTVKVNNPVSVQPEPNTLPSFKKPFGLICVGADPTATIEWYKDGHLLTIDAQMTLPAGNSTLKFNPLLPSHGGLYQCISEKGSSRIISVGYRLTSGPWSVKITGPKMAAAGERTDFTCSADCSPSCTYTWSMDGKTAQGQVATVTPSDEIKAFELECTALNPDTGKSLKTVETIQVNSPALTPIGPWSVRVNKPETVTAGERADFSCSADCTPPCTYSWSVEGSTVSGPGITLTPSGVPETFELECTATNPQSGESEKKTEKIKVNNPVVVQPESGKLPSLNESFSLTCVGADPTATIKWYKDGRLVTIDAHMSLSTDNSIIRFNSLLPSHGGFYRCEPSKGGSSIVSLGYLLSYGKLSVNVTGPDTAVVGKEHVYECNANCEIECSIYWTFRGGFPSGSYSQRQTVIRWTPDQPDTTQVFTCVVENTAARRSATYSKTVKVIKPSGPDPQPSPHPKDRFKFCTEFPYQTDVREFHFEQGCDWLSPVTSTESGSMALKPRTALCLVFSMGLLVHWAL